MTTDRNSGGVENPDLNQAQRLLGELYRQRTELGEIAADLISLLEAAGVSTTDGSEDRATDSPPA